MPEKIKINETREVPKEFRQVERAASISAKSLNKEKRTFEIIWSTGAEVIRRGWTGAYIEKLAMGEKNVRMARLKNGAPFLEVHNSYSLRSTIGVVESADLKDGVGTAVIRLSKRPEVDSILQDIEDGIFRNISVGYDILKYEKTEERDKVPVYTITDWEPSELSLVPIGADDSAKIRSKEKISFDNIEETEKNKEDSEINKSQRNVTMPEKSEATIDLEKVKKDAAEEARKGEVLRSKDIREAGKKAKMTPEFTQKCIDDNLSVEATRALIIDEVEKRSANEVINSNQVLVGTDIAAEHRSLGMQNALLVRAQPDKYKVEEHGKEFLNLTLIDMAREICRAHNVSTKNITVHEMAKRALATSDFPLILANTMNKSLRDAYGEVPQTFRTFTRQVYVSNFKEITRTQLGDAPKLELVAEGGKVKQGSISEAAEKYFVSTYAKKLAFTRKHIINDDMDMVSRIPALFGRRARDLESDLAWAVITGNPLMADGFALFSTQHKNLAAVNAAIDIGPVGIGRAAMRTQKGLDGAVMNSRPEYLLVPAALETKAEQFCVLNIQPATDSNTNPFKGKLKPVSEARLDDASLTAWYLAASPAQLDMLEIAYLEGATGPMLEQKVLGGAEGVEIEVLHDVGVKAIDYRGFFKNIGV